MASYLRPRRGKRSTAITQLGADAPLKRGEVFFEVPDTGVGTGLGKVKMGDGTTAYESLPYFLDVPEVDYDNAVVAWTNTTEADADPVTANPTYLGNIIPSANLKTIFTNLKKLLLNYNSQITELNNDLNTLSFEQNDDGKWGYRVGGADSVIPFSENVFAETPGTATAANIHEGYTAWVNGVLLTGTAKVPPKTQSGSGSVYSIDKGITKSVPITFSEPFAVVPSVSASYTSYNDGNAGGHPPSVSVGSITKVGCVIYIYNQNYYQITLSSVSYSWTASTS